jgi:hypothetical protein
VFEEERAEPRAYGGPFDGYSRRPGAVSKTCLVRFDKQPLLGRSAEAVGRPVEIRAYADRSECWQDGAVVGEHVRVFGRDKHRLRSLALRPGPGERKPGALRNGAPFKDGTLPPAMRACRRKLAVKPGGDRQMVDILVAVLTDGLEAVEAACAEAFGSGNVHSAARRHPEHPGPPPRARRRP